MILGVDPAEQGRGIGRMLLEHIFDRADATGAACYLETTQPKNVSFYQNSGLEVVEHGPEPTSGLAYWTLRRPPRA
jgi:GNAT superfamily N-acetyltransferase